MIDIFHYHWIWYLIGGIYSPHLTFMIWLSIYFPNTLPLPLFIIGWVIAVMKTVTIKKEK